MRRRKRRRGSRADDVLAFCVPFEISCFEFSALYSNTGKATGHFLLPGCVLSYALNLFIRLYLLLPLGVTLLLGAASLFKIVFK